MILSATATFRPDDGTPVGNALGDLNTLVTTAARLPGVCTVRVAVFFTPAPAYLDVLDATGTNVPLNGDLATLEGTPQPGPVAELVAASLLATNDSEGV